MIDGMEHANAPNKERERREKGRKGEREKGRKGEREKGRKVQKFQKIA
jgi:hypothetical protein